LIWKEIFFGNKGIFYLSEAIKQNQKITYLDLAHNNIGDEGIKYFAETIKHNTALTFLDLQGNQIGYEGIKHVAKSMKENLFITELKLYNLTTDKLFEKRIKQIESYITRNKKLNS